ncbi:hypothetical protein CP965_08905 [Halarcobacter mediterraneus]|uniref:Uncharacterized protein n=1 Tax=Halarcobacter mediterraneus TaxID=2023153 RepID=A0A4Q1B249_9BACT|nr:hypothetical protein [Halarcobacter mediterraneus]RXK12686.1 hypothetical protein CP965_08905 [Halarcobacter mediterraneus]
MKNSILLFIIVLFFNGCVAITGHNQTMRELDKVFLSNSCNYEIINEKIEDNEDILFWSLQGGSLARNCKDYKRSNEFFDKAEQEYKKIDIQNTLKNISQGTKEVLVNNNINAYEGNIYERIMVNTYKALNFASLGDHSNARVEFNRTLDRQRRAKEFFEDEIKKKKEQLYKQESQTIKKLVENPKSQNIVYSQYKNLLSDFQAYPNFINPFSSYLAGIYFFLQKDYQKARTLFKESLQMNPDNKQIKEDYLLNERFLKNEKDTTNYLWLIYENGQGIYKEEKRLDLPLFLVSNRVLYTAIALPSLKERNYSYDYLQIKNQKTIEICSMDTIIKTEFKKEFPLILSQAILNSLTKTLAQYEFQRKSDALGSFLSIMYQGLTTRADVRIWNNLPKSFESKRIELKENPIIIKDDNENIIELISIPKGKNAIIYIKSEIRGKNTVHSILY